MNDDVNQVPRSKADPIEPDLQRYDRQIRFAEFGIEGQRAIRGSSCLIVGCGALGSVLANTLCRAGVGNLRIVDRDFLERNNLQRQVLFDEHDVDAGLPKAIAAANRLRQINSQVTIDPIVADVSNKNISTLMDGIGVIVDGTDNFETRFLLNDASIKFGIPWVYGGCIGSEGQTMTILPGQTACLRCLMLDGPPPPGTTATCDSAGILGPIINVIASIEACEALKILAGKLDDVSRSLTVVDLWSNQFRSIDLSKLRSAVDCPACQQNQLDWLDGRQGSQSVVMCGRNAVQLSFPEQESISLEALESKLESVSNVSRNRFLLRFQVDGVTVTAFPDGRAIISGTEDVSLAKTIYAKFIGN